MTVLQRILIFAVVLVWWTPLRAQDLVTPSDRVTTFVHVRSAPDSDAAEVGRLAVGQSARLVESVPRWHEVQLPDGTRGFVSKAFTSVSQALVPRLQDELRIHFLNIGTGTCTVVECPGAGGPAIIVDCGSTGATDEDLDTEETKAYVEDVLSAQSSPIHVVLSHPDQDHYNRIPGVLVAASVASIWQGGDPAEYDAAGFAAWLKKQENQGATLHRNFAANFHNGGQPLDEELSCGAASVFILTANTGIERNTQSLVLMLEYRDFTAIFTGDAEGQTETQALANFDGAVKANVLTASHHGASTKGSNSQDWARATAPEAVVYSAGNKFNHPRCVSMNRFTSVAETREHAVRCGDARGFRPLFRTKAAHYMTEVVGAVIVTSNGRSPMSVNCTRSTECGVKVTH